MLATAAISQRVREAPTPSIGTRYKKPSGISAVVWESITAIKPIISAAINSVDRRFPHINIEKNGISGLSRDCFDLISFYDRPSSSLGNSNACFGYRKNLCKLSSGRVIRFDCRKSISVTIEVMPGAHPHVFPHESFILHLQLNRESFNRKIGLNGLIATPDLK